MRLFFKTLLLLSIVTTYVAPASFAIEQIWKQSRLPVEESRQEEHFRDLDQDINNLFLALRNNVAFGISTDGLLGSNIDGQYQVVADTGNANTQFSITHTLNRVPNGYIVVKNDTDGVVYDGTSANTSTTLFLRHGGANAAITVFII